MQEGDIILFLKEKAILQTERIQIAEFQFYAKLPFGGDIDVKTSAAIQGSASKRIC